MQVRIHIDGVDIERVLEYKFLGLIIGKKILLEVTYKSYR